MASISNQTPPIYCDFLNSGLYEPGVLNIISGFTKSEGAALVILLNPSQLRSAANKNAPPLELIKQIRPSAETLTDEMKQLTIPNTKLNHQIKRLQFLLKFSSEQGIQKSLSSLTDKEIDQLMLYIGLKGNERLFVSIIKSNNWKRVTLETRTIIQFLANNLNNTQIIKAIESNDSNKQPTRIGNQEEDSLCVLQ